MRRFNRIALLLLVPVVFLAAGCASYSERYADLRPQLMQSDFDAALLTIEEGREGNAMLLYHLERGLVLHYAGRWVESNTAFDLGERLADELYTKSVSQAVLSLVTSDNTIDYRAQAFEMAMIPYYRALNYIYLGQREDALVEARKASLYLREFEDPELGGDGSASDVRDLLRNNAFLQYFSAMLYEWDGDVNDAWIAYRHAAAAWRDAAGALAADAPPELAVDLARCARYLGFTAELEELRGEYPDLFAEYEPVDAAGTGEVVLLFELDFIAHKVENKFTVPILHEDEFDDDDEFSFVLADRHRRAVVYDNDVVAYWLSVAMPELVRGPPRYAGARVSAGLAGTNTTTSVVDDLSGRAEITFESRRGTVLAKTIARGLTKYWTWKAAEKKGKGLGLLANVFNSATETADTRGWLTLPGHVAMARLSLPPGVYDLQVDLVDERGVVLHSETIGGVAVRTGDWTFLSRRVF